MATVSTNGVCVHCHGSHVEPDPFGPGFVACRCQEREDAAERRLWEARRALGELSDGQLANIVVEALDRLGGEMCGQAFGEGVG